QRQPGEAYDHRPQRKERPGMISPRLRKAILAQLKLDDFDLRDETTADQVPGWDSLSHVKILTAVEAECGLRFRAMEGVRLAKVRLKKGGELQAMVDKKLG